MNSKVSVKEGKSQLKTCCGQKPNFKFIKKDFYYQWEIKCPLCNKTFNEFHNITINFCLEPKDGPFYEKKVKLRINITVGGLEYKFAYNGISSNLKNSLDHYCQNAINSLYLF